MDLFTEGGWTTYPTALFGLATIAIGWLQAMQPQRRLFPLGATMGGLTVSMGLLGVMKGFAGVVQASVNAEAADVKTIVTACATQALNNAVLTSGVLTLALLGGAVAAARLAMAKAPGPTPAT